MYGDYTAYAVLFKKEKPLYSKPDEIEYKAWALRSRSGDIDNTSFQPPTFSEKDFLLLLEDLITLEIPYFII
jgi:hypothetical protein